MFKSSIMSLVFFVETHYHKENEILSLLWVHGKKARLHEPTNSYSKLSLGRDNYFQNNYPNNDLTNSLNIIRHDNKTHTRGYPPEPTRTVTGFGFSLISEDGQDEQWGHKYPPRTRPACYIITRPGPGYFVLIFTNYSASISHF